MKLTDTDEKNLSRREWLLIILILMMVEYWLISVSHTYKDEQSLLNYISFASTIASLLLAVVAIVYSFFQSDSANKSSAALINQVEHFSDVANEIGQSSNSIASQLSRLSAITDKMDKLEASMDKSTDRLTSIEAGVGELKEQKAQAQEKTRESRQNQKQTHSVARQILRQSTFEADLMAISLSRVMLKKMEVTPSDFLKTIYSAPGNIPGNHWDNAHYFKVGMQLLPILRSVGLIDYYDLESPIKITPTLAGELQEFADEIMQTAHKPLKGAINAVLSVTE